MRIALVGESFAGESAIGPWRYNEEVLTMLRKRGLDVRAVESNPARRRFLLAINSFTVLPYRVLSSMRGVDIVHATDPSSAICLPISGRKTLVTVHDLMPAFHRQFSLADRVFSRLVFSAVKKCRVIIASSRQTESDLVKRLGVPQQKIEVINLGVSDRFQVLPRVGKDHDTVGFVGSLNTRKKADFAVRGFEILRKKYRPTARLVIVGQGPEHQALSAMVQQSGLQRDVKFVPFMKDDELVTFYNKLGVLVMPSDYEGFGFPIIEAQKCGTPVIVRAQGRISPEVTTACVKVEDEGGMALAIRDLLTKKAYYDEVVQRGLIAARRFTWEAYADRLVNVYRRLAR